MSENPQQNLETKLRTFRDEVMREVEEERQTGETAHFEGMEFNADELTEDDMNIWKKIQDRTVTKRDTDLYRDSFHIVEGDLKTFRRDTPDSRQRFWAFANNLATSIIAERQMEELDK